jgi:NADH:ubiquinone reductase (H+-translocating)
VLATFPERLSEKARRQLERLGVEVRTGVAVMECDGDGVTAAGERIEARTVIWGAGVVASPAAKWLGVEADRGGRVIVGPDLAVPGHPTIFVIGDTAAVMQDGEPVPGVAPAAKQMGTHVARLIDARIRGDRFERPFRYRHQGNLATIGRKAAVADFGWLRLSGFPAWVLWAAAHVWFLIGWRNRFVVSLNWLWSYVTFERGARLITSPGQESHAQDAPASVESRAAA